MEIIFSRKLIQAAEFLCYGTDMSEQDTFESLKYNISIEANGTRVYRNAQGQLHREGGPAIIATHGSEFWYYNGQKHRTDGPAVIWANGEQEWYLHGVRCSESHFLKMVSEEADSDDTDAGCD